MSIETALASAVKTRRDQPAAGDSVRGYVRSHLPSILAAREMLSWAEIADILNTEGVRWRSGSKMTAASLRTLVCRLTDKAAKSARRKGMVTPKQSLVDRGYEDKSPISAIEDLASSVMPEFPVLQADKSTPPKPVSLGASAREKILAEMRRSASERS